MNSSSPRAQVFASPTHTRPMIGHELTRAYYRIGPGHPAPAEGYPLDRLTGPMCKCEPNTGQFNLHPRNDPANIEGGKRYMTCRNCGCVAHL